jgi:leucine dehydrogenase
MRCLIGCKFPSTLTSIDGLKMHPQDSPAFDGHEQIRTLFDEKTGLTAIIAVHSTRLGPACGGTRYKLYDNNDAALEDALKLSGAMSRKCALAGIPFGGGKAVIIGDSRMPKSDELLSAYGRFLESLGGTFITGEDMGFQQADCETVSRTTRYVVGTGAGAPYAATAKGVFHALEAVLQVAFKGHSLAGVHVAVQGLGGVGWLLCELLHAAGARLTVADVIAERAIKAKQQFGAHVVAPESLLATRADLLAPCAAGGILHAGSVRDLKVRAIAGAANNQLANKEAGEQLASRGILFAPDFVTSAGGVIGALDDMAAIHNTPATAKAVAVPLEVRLLGIRSRLLAVFARAQEFGVTPEQAALDMANEILAS